MKKIILKSVLLAVFFIPLFCYLGKFEISKSAPVTILKDQLSNAQLSYFARLGLGNTAGNSVIYITTVGTTLSINNYNVSVGDTLYIANSAGGNTPYLVKDVGGTNAIVVSGLGGTGSLGVGNTTAGLYVVAERYSSHTISFSPSDSITGGTWQVLIPAASTLQSDTLPDTNGFDLGTLNNASVTCPGWGVGVGTTSTGVGTTLIVNSISYHTINCPLGVSGTNPVGGGATGTIVIGTGTSMLINPAPATNHVVGQANASADTYSIILRHLDAGGTVVDTDTTTGKIAVTESVRVTATVDPTITFSIGNSGVTTVGTTLCGAPMGSGAPNTTGATVTFGSLNLSAFNSLAQFLQCTTNALNGYVIQTFESGQLTMIGGSTTIPDTTCPSNACTPTSAAAWITNTASGLGYGLEVGTTSAGGSPTLGIGATNLAKPFGNGYSNAQTIMSRTNTPASTDSFYVCYRITTSNFQPAGTYQNEINYIATATF